MSEATSKSYLPHEEYTAETFKDIKLHSDGKQSTIRHQAAQPCTTSAEEELKLRQREKRLWTRDTEKRRLGSMYSLNITLVETAIKNKRVLDIVWRDFTRDRAKGKVPMNKGGPYRNLPPLHFTEKEGPLLLVDKEGVTLFWYFPGYMGKGLQASWQPEIILDDLVDLVQVYSPRIDKDTGDRRSRTSAATRASASLENITTRCGKTNPLDVTLSDLEETEQEPVVEGGGEGPWELGEAIAPSFQEPTVGESAGTGGLEFRKANREVGWESDETMEARGSLGSETKVDSEKARDIVLNRENLAPGAFTFSPGWFQTGMHNKRHIEMSLQFREALQDGSSRELIKLLEHKRVYDYALGDLVNIIHSPLAEQMKMLRRKMLKVEGPTSTVLQNGWTSDFPCIGMGINRQPGMHRDTKGFRGNMDFITVLGSFHGGEEGKFKLQDLNVTFDWRPGCLGAFDGYDLTHEVLDWKEGYRITLISFCRASTWLGLGLKPQVELPRILEVEENVELAKSAKKAAGEKNKRKNKELIERDRESARIAKIAKTSKKGPQALFSHSPQELEPYDHLQLQELFQRQKVMREMRASLVEELAYLREEREKESGKALKAVERLEAEKEELESLEWMLF